MVFPNFVQLHPMAIKPIFGNNDFTNAGVDFYSMQDVTIAPRGHAEVSTGVGWKPTSTTKSKFYMKIEARSGLSFKNSIETGAGIIDMTYTGEIKIKLYNNSDTYYPVLRGDRIAQGIIHEIPDVALDHQEAQKVDRGDKGFGSTGN